MSFQNIKQIIHMKNNFSMTHEISTIDKVKKIEIIYAS